MCELTLLLTLLLEEALMAAVGENGLARKREDGKREDQMRTKAHAQRQKHSEECQHEKKKLVGQFHFGCKSSPKENKHTALHHQACSIDIKHIR